MIKNKSIALITGTEATRLELSKQLESLLFDYVDIVSYASDMGIKQTISNDLVVISSKLIIDEVMPHIDPKCPIILARRALNISNIDRLFSIPETTTALLVNDTPETSMEVTRLIKELGMSHINLIPYYPGCRITAKPSLAITPGETMYVPDFIEEIIDIGPRIIDLTTIVEILEKLSILDEKAHFVSAKYMETIIKLGRQLYKSIGESTKINDYLVRVLNQVNDGIMAFNNDGKISVFNQKCEEIFKLRHTYALGKNISHIIKDKDMLHFLHNKELKDDQLFKINSEDIVINKFTVDKLDSIVCTLKNTKEMAEMENRLRKNLIKKGHIGKYRFTDIIGSSKVMLAAINTARKISKADLSILIHGESGTGKELFASAIHNESERNSGPFLAVNFSALSEDLVESELFGYEEGAFTGAKKGGKTGLFEQANNGTIFLDEIGDTSMKIQARLLRVLQEKEIMRVGGTEIIPINVRVIAATNKNLLKMCEEGRFRSDLYYRLKRLYLNTPPLRDRKDDIEDLVYHFAAKNHKKSMKISNEAMDTLKAYDWPGNVRELESTIEYMIAVCDEEIITSEHLPQDFTINRKDREHSYDDCLLQKLSCKGIVDEFIFILRTVHNHNMQGKSIGRKAISELSSEEFVYLSEEQIRTRTNTLSELGLLVKSKGRSGMHITIKGINLIKNIR
ncbi:MAG: sigma-54 interaction domain-containing protein [Bacillota bacterium]